MRGNHPIFARVFDRLSEGIERELGGQRARLLSGLSGRVLEIGAGNGANFAHYPASVVEVVAVEPEPYLRTRAERAACRAPVPVRVRNGLADELPFGAAEFDAAVLSLVLCSVPDPASALAELRRVLKPGGEIRFMEHVASADRAKSKVQELLDGSGLWPKLAGGCHCHRDTVAEIRAAGFRVLHEQSHDVGPAWIPPNPHVIGTAERS